MKISRIIFILSAIIGLSAAAVVRLPFKEDHQILHQARVKRQNAPSGVATAVGTGVSTLAAVGLSSLFGPIGTVVGAMAQGPLSDMISSFAGGILGRDAPVVTFRDMDGSVYFLGRVNSPEQHHRNALSAPTLLYNQYR